MRPLLRAATSALLLLSACARDASLPPPPPPPGPGSIQGRVVYAVAGQSTRVAAAGAQVGILGTNLSTVTEADGRFFLGGVTQVDGVLLLQASTDGSGAPNRQSMLQLADIQAGPGRDIALGDVPVVENAAVRGRATLGDVGTPGGHSGTLVFVPQGPFMTQTADDGSYSLPDLPAGTVTLSFFRDRYASETIDGMVLTAGQSYTVRDIVMRPMAAGPPSPGTIAGRVSAAGGNVTAALVRATSATGTDVGPVSPDATGAFTLGAPAGVYSVSVALAGFNTAEIGNVLVAPGATVELAIALTATPAVCTPGVACSSGCTVGQVTCPNGPNGAVTCTATGFVMNGTPCGPGLTCQSGSCLPACNPGVACQSVNACHAAAVSCATGAAVCQEIVPTQLLPVGTTCGPFQVCTAAGACIACAAGTPCALPPPGNPCHAGAYDCRTGAPVCVDTGAALTAGTPCGPGLVCNASGSCAACQQGALCTPANPCHAGAVSCATGAPVCNDTGAVAFDGSICGTDLVCHAGTCGPCAVASPCDGLTGHAAPPASPDPCKTYATVCASGLPVCAVASNKPQNTPCGGGLVCVAGTCTTPGNSLRLVTAPGAMHALPNQSLAVTLQLVDVGGSPVLTPDTVTLTAPAGAQVPPAALTTSAVDGTVAFPVTLGRAVGPQTFHASAPSAVAPLDFVATADAPADGTLVPMANATHTFGYSVAPGPASALPTEGVNGIAVASDGTIYFTDEFACVVKRILPSGQLDVVAGVPGVGCGFNGEAGVAASVMLYYPFGLALDEPRGILYVADQYNHRVRAIDLVAGRIATVAGDGTQGTPPYGDGGLALSAQLYFPQHVAVGPESPPALYVGDAVHERVRRIDGVTHVITSVIENVPFCTGTGPVALVSLNSGSGGGSMAFDEKGSLYLSGNFCVPAANGSQISGVVRRAADGSLVLVAGALSGVAANGVPATSVDLADDPCIAFDSAPIPGGGRRSNLFLSVANGNYVARVDGATGRFDLVLGTGASGTAGDFGPAVGATRSRPLEIAFRPGSRELYVAGGSALSVDLVAGAGGATASSASLASLSPASTVFPSQQIPAPLEVLLKDGAGAPLAGFPVAFAPDPAGLPGGWIQAPLASTAADGIGGVSARPGLALGRYGFVASFRDVHGDHVSGSPVVFDVNAAAPPAGTVFAVVNANHISGAPANVPGPGAVVQLSQPRGLAVASDGTVYFSDGSEFIFRMAPSGLVDKIAGNNTGAGVADGVPATASAMDPWGLALDEAAGQLYFGDASNGRVRRIDLTLQTPFVFGVAGGGPANVDGPASATSLASPSRVRLVQGKLYLADRTFPNDRLRRVDLASGTIETYLPNKTAHALASDNVANCVGNGPVVFWECSSDPGCSVAEAPDGRLYVSGYFCGSGTVSPPTAGFSSPTPGIVRVETDGTFTHLAGTVGFPLLDGIAGSSTGFQQVPQIATDPAGDLWLTMRGFDASNQKVGFFQAVSGAVGVNSVFHVVGLGPPGVEYVDQSLTSFSSPMDVACGAGHVFVTDDNGPSSVFTSAVRIVW